MMSLELRDFSIGYEGTRKPVVTVSKLAFPSGINLLLGRNGSGKSTLLRGLTNQYPGVVRAGTALLDGVPLVFSRVGMVTQRPTDSIVQGLTFFENVLLSASERRDFLKPTLVATKRNRGRMMLRLANIGLAEDIGGLLAVGTEHLSGGQQQLLAITMRLLREPQLLLLDEFTASLDAANSTIVVEAVEKVARGGSVVLLATHQQELCERLDANIYEVTDGSVREKLIRS